MKLIEIVESKRYEESDIESIWVDVQKDFYDFLSQKRADDYLNAIDKLYSLLGKNIKFLNSLYKNNGISPYKFTPSKNDTYTNNLSKINRARPDDLMLDNNITDALAITITCELNALNNSSKKVFYLCTSSTRILPIVEENIISLKTNKRIIDTNICRNLYYMLFRLSFGKENIHETKKNIDKYLFLIKRYKQEVLRLQSSTLFLPPEQLNELSYLFSEVVDVFNQFENQTIYKLFSNIDQDWLKNTKVTPNKLQELYNTFKSAMENKKDFKNKIDDSNRKVENWINKLQKDLESSFEAESYG